MEFAERQNQQHDHLGFFVFVAFALHLMLILGISFATDLAEYNAPQLEVTLAQYQSREAPEDARFVAQANQAGSGTLAERAELTTRRQAEFSDNRIRELGGAPLVTEVKPQAREDAIVTTVNDALRQVVQKPVEEEPEPVFSAAVDPEIRKLSESIASLEASEEIDRTLGARSRRCRLPSQLAHPGRGGGQPTLPISVSTVRHLRRPATAGRDSL